MIPADQLPQALQALQRLIIHAKTRAYDAGDAQLGALLNDIELFPEYLADPRDRTEEFSEMLAGIVRVHPTCRYIAEEFERASLPAT